MSNKSVSDFVAASMDAVLKSEAHKSLFGTQYKFASDENDAKCSKCGSDTCTCGDSGMADDQDAKKKKLPPWLEKKEDTDSAWDDNDARKKKDEDDSAADDDAARKKKDEDDSSADDLQSSAFDVAIDSLLTASAALDSVGMEKSSAFSLRLASLVVEAKKKDKEDKKKNDSNDAKDKAAKAKEKEKLAKEKEKAAKEKAKEKAAKDTQMAKDKASKEKAKEKAEKEKAAEKAAKEKEKAKASSKK